MVPYTKIPADKNAFAFIALSPSYFYYTLTIKDRLQLRKSDLRKKNIKITQLYLVGHSALETKSRANPHNVESFRVRLTDTTIFYMVTHMKTTIDIADDLLLRSKRVSSERGMTLRELVSEGLLYIVEKRSAKPAFRVRAVTFKGKGLAPEFQQAAWGAIRDAAYEGHGS